LGSLGALAAHYCGVSQGDDAATLADSMSVDALAAGGRRGSPGSVLFAGQAYYNAWYLSRELRELGWQADVLNWDLNRSSDLFYHGQDFRLEGYDGRLTLARHLAFYCLALSTYDIFHFSNAQGIRFSDRLHDYFAERFGPGAEIRLLKRLGKKIVYSNNGSLDGVAQSSIQRWEPSPCTDCQWRDRPDVCSDERNLAWGRFRNSLADYQVNLGGIRLDYNGDPSVHEVPEFYCLDSDVWRPDLTIPPELRLPIPDDTVKIYHAVGNYESRTEVGSRRNDKSTHIYFPLIERLKSEGHDVELLFFTNVPNRDLRYYQAQADIVVSMLSYGFFGATEREAMMLGKPVVCYLRPEWLEQMRAEIPDYVDEVPVVSATPETVHDVLVDLIEDRDKRERIGAAGRRFAAKWHSADAAARRFDSIYRGLLAGRPATESFR
jgi:glycosyltransferase involved in cell wall biosynthesis